MIFYSLAEKVERNAISFSELRLPAAGVTNQSSQKWAMRPWGAVRRT